MVRLDKWTRCWLAASVVFGAALLFAAFTVPAYNGTISQTLVEANGKKVIFIVAVPLVGALLAMGTIAARRRREREGVGITTWLLLGALGVLTIGPFVAPVPICLLVAVLRIQETGRVHSQGESHSQSL
jgi:vacuolar-type H+-ATPase subunit I/STV1